MSGYQLNQSQINVIGGLIRFIEDFDKKDFGTIKIVTKNASPVDFIKLEYPIPEASYSEPVRKFIITCRNILGHYPEYRSQKYKNSDFKLTEYTPVDEIINRVFAVLDAESYCDGPLMKYLQRGIITSWLYALRKNLSDSAESGVIHEPSSYEVDDLVHHYTPIEAVAEEDLYLDHFRYTVEPADDECWRYLNEDKYSTWKIDKSGGIGMQFQSKKLYTYEWSDYPSLSDFLDQLVYVEPTKELSPEQRRVRYGGNKTGAYPSYYSNDMDAIRDYLVRYIESFASEASADVLAAIDNYRGSFDTSYFGRNIVLDEHYLNGIFRESSLIVAKYLFKESLFNTMIKDIGSNFFEEAFERLWRIELFFIDCPGLFHFDNYWFYGGIFTKDRCFVCDRNDYYSSIRPFILFLSNFRLILSTYMAIKLYGQCHFSICWETDSGEDMAPEQWPHPGRG